MELKLFDNGADFSDCRKYRYTLWRTWNIDKPKIMFLGLNPSTADEQANDLTLVRVLNFSNSWGYGSLVVINLFARISTSPRLLKSSSNPIGLFNNFELKTNIKDWSENEFCDLWLGWGVNGSFMKRDRNILKDIKKYSEKKMQNFTKAQMPLAIGLTKAGHPRHPLYMANSSYLRTFQI